MNVRQSCLYTLLEQLEHRDSDTRFEAARRLAYVSQGTPMFSTGPDHHLHLILSNCNLLREVGALQAVYEALRNAGGRWAMMRYFQDLSPYRVPLTAGLVQ